MRRTAGFILATTAMLQGCGSGERTPNSQEDLNSATAPLASPPPPAAPTPAAAAGRWELQASGDGSTLVLLSPGGAAALRLFCPAGKGRLLVNVPALRGIASEERLSFGSGGTAIALVADPGGDRRRGGVSAAGPVPADLAAALAGPLSASYGAQSSGPHSPPPPDMARAFVAACSEGAAPPPPESGRAPAQSPCLLQGTERLPVRPLRAVGTEPFWGARIEGRCVTYSHPEDQKGTRIWTQYTAGANGGGTWSGTLAGKPFEVRIRAAPGCSDGMSDQVYPLAAELRVAGETRQGCAARS